MTFAGSGVVAADQNKLDRVHREIQDDHPTLDHISPDHFEPAIGSNDTIIFDVREPGEFEVSHIPGAIQIDPDVDPKTFMRDYGESIAGMDVVFYCSVGRRSSDLAAKLTDALVSSGAGDIYNLENGVFGWHNQSRTLVTRQSSVEVQTDYVHPYNWWWGRLLERRDKATYEPVIE